MTKNDRTHDDERAARMVRAARRFSGESQDDDTPITAQEEALMAEVKSQHPRHTREELREMARALARAR
ncbi:hypothetical protein [Brevundimonas halotolerans]|jgi:hypothetical protein|uniref:Uncharacterized protein n=1 Tax=Brevundimonas halotolerans TaxID=69670 RepID=A0A7W9A4K7_9CAUL|nr:hypothetical protein [Brevundimonas halotolerans]MBB5661127.1 hypothetical protein [Brevundimonas halotolerans]